MTQPTRSYSPTKITATLMASQAVNAGSNALFVTVAAILMVRLSGGDDALAGIPSSLVLIASAAAAFGMGRLMDRSGRRVGLSLGHGLGLAGAVLAGLGAWSASIPLFLLGVIVLGLSWGSLDLARYAAADISPAARRARSISLVVLGGLVGSLAGPTLIGLAQGLAGAMSLPAEIGVWPVMLVMFVLGAAVLMLFLRPDPLLIARWQAVEAAAEPRPEALSGPVSARSFWQILADPRAGLAVGGLVFSQLAMVVVMTIMPVHMAAHARGLSDISLVLLAHTVGMTGSSLVTGLLADRCGRAAVIGAGGLALSAACILAPLQTTVPWLAASLFLLGLGWNLSYVGSSTLLDEVLRPAEKGVGQGSADALVKVASGLGSLASGLIFAAGGFAFTSWLTIMIAALPAVLAFYLGLMRPHAASSRPGSIGRPAAD